MNDEQLRILISVADHGSFSSAEESCFMTKQSMFKQIAKLEEEVGCPLFIRSKSGVVLSEAGRIFYDGAKKALLAPLWSADKKRVLNYVNRYLSARAAAEGERQSNVL